jgi:hypothetical protein
VIWGGQMSWLRRVSVSMARHHYFPCLFINTDVDGLEGLFRASNVLKHYRGFALPAGAKFNAWLERLFEHPAFKATCSTEALYLDSYER